MAIAQASIGSLVLRMKWVLLIVFAMRAYLLVTALQQQSYLTDDSIQYLTLAENMREHGVYSQSYTPPFAADSQRTPGYPVFIWLLGRRPWAILIVQHLLSLFSGVLIFAILSRRFDRLWGMRGAVLYLLQPYGAIFASYVLSETLFICLLLAWFWAYLRFWEAGEWKWLAFSLFLLVLATFVRPVTLILLPMVCILALVRAYRTRQFLLWPLMAVVLIPPMLLGPWYMRVHTYTGQYAMTSMGPMGMLHGRLGGLEAWRQGLGTDEDDLYMTGDSIVALTIGLPQLRTYPPTKQTHETEQLASGMGTLTLRYYLNHPLDAIAFQLHSLGAMFKGVGYGWAKELTHSKVAATLLAGTQLALNVLCYLGLMLAVVRMRKWSIHEQLAFWTVAITLLVSAAAWADGRYRAVIDPLLVMLLVFVLWNYESRQRLMA